VLGEVKTWALVNSLKHILKIYIMTFLTSFLRKIREVVSGLQRVSLKKTEILFVKLVRK